MFLSIVERSTMSAPCDSSVTPDATTRSIVERDRARRRTRRGSRRSGRRGAVDLVELAERELGEMPPGRADLPFAPALELLERLARPLRQRGIALLLLVIADVERGGAT
jgi:hypothetical protein